MKTPIVNLKFIQRLFKLSSLFVIAFVLFSNFAFSFSNESGSSQPKYLNTPQTIAYNKSDFLYGLNLAKETIRKQNQVVLLEGNMDVVASSQAG